MDSLKEFLLPKRFSVYGYIVAVFNVLAGVIATVITAIKSTERRQFQCNSRGVLDDKDFLTTKCFNQYSQEYNGSLPLYGFALMSFASLVVVCIIYSWCCVKSRVEQIEQECTTNQNNLRPTPINCHYIFTCYLVNLLIRLVLGIVYAIPQLTGLYALDFPPKFKCNWNLRRPNSGNFNTTNSNSSSVITINCQNSFAEEKTVWAMVVWILHVLFACLVLFEVLYILARAFHDDTFTRDLKFCQKHIFNNRIISLSQRDFSLLRSPILQQTEYLEPLIPLVPSEDDNRRAIDDVYVDLVIHSGWVTHDFDKTKKRHELLNVYLKQPKGSLQINNINELFVSEQKSYHNILVIGRPGIGKTSLCTKIIRNWCKGELNRFKIVFLFRFRHLSGERFNQMSLVQFLHETEHTMNIDPDTLQNVMDNPQSILFIFDGLDEYKHRENLIKDQSEFNSLNGLKDEMPVTSIYAKLLQKKLLPGATILTTSRPNAVGTLRILNVQFDRVAEILGFTPEKVKSYIDKFCKDNATTASKIWLHIKSNFNLLYLCYIPVNCWIVCSLLYDFIEKHSSSLDSLVLPTTLTDIYKGALRLFLFKHSPEYQQQMSISDYTNDTFSTTIEEVLSKLGKLAIKGMENEQLVFEEVEVQGLENCGLLNCMPSKTNPALGFARASQYCFIHLTLQEFLAAREIAKTYDLNEVVQFINDKATNAKWHLVIQFVAGLLIKHTFEASMCFEDMLCHSLIQGNNKLLLLILKCFYELSNEEAAERAARKLESCKEFSGSITFFDVAIPDCTAIVFVLRHCMTRLVSLSICDSLNFGDYGCSELLKIFVCKVSDSHKHESSHLTVLNLLYNNITDQGVLHLSDSLKSENCHLTQLSLLSNKITDQGVLHLSDALKSENCHLTQLNLSTNQITDQGVLHLSDALKSENCHLTQLDLPRNQITDQVVLHLSDALKSENCHLTQLDLFNNKITDQGVLLLSDALKSENCHLTQLALSWNGITDQGVLHLSDALKSENCHLTQLDLSANQITDQGVLHLSDALKSENCHLTQLNLSLNGITDQGVLHLSDTLKSENCHLNQLKLYSYGITDQG